MEYYRKNQDKIRIKWDKNKIDWNKNKINGIRLDEMNKIGLMG